MENSWYKVLVLKENIMSLNFPFQKAISQKNADGTHSVIVHHTHGVVTEVSFSLVAHSEAMAKTLETWLNSHVAVQAVEKPKIMVGGPNKPLEVRTDGDTIIKLKKDAVPEKNIGKHAPIDLSAKVGKQDEVINTSAKSIFTEPSKAEQVATEAAATAAVTPAQVPPTSPAPTQQPGPVEPPAQPTATMSETPTE
jgi:hypothetical protein